MKTFLYQEFRVGDLLIEEGRTYFIVGKDKDKPPYMTAYEMNRRRLDTWSYISYETAAYWEHQCRIYRDGIHIFGTLLKAKA